MKKNEVVRFLFFRTLGNFLILAMIFGFLATFGPVLYFEGRFWAAQASGIEFQAPKYSVGSQIIQSQAQVQSVNNQKSLLGSILNGDKAQVLNVKSSDFSLLIPKIGASEVVNPNIDPSNPDEYKTSLKSGVAHAKGTAFPGLNGTTYIFAHSADSFWNVGRYNAVFYLLKELVPGDKVIIVFQGKRYDYVVTEKKIINPDDVSYMTSNIGGGEQLILQTCWPPGTTLKRLMVFAKPVIPNSAK